jgi:hypothetical protein
MSLIENKKDTSLESITLPGVWGENYIYFRNKIILSDRIIDNFSEKRKMDKKPALHINRGRYSKFKEFLNLFGTSNTAYARNAVFKDHISILNNIEEIIEKINDGAFEALFRSKDEIFEDINRTLSKRDEAIKLYEERQEDVLLLFKDNDKSSISHLMRDKMYYDTHQKQAVCTFNANYHGYERDKFLVHTGPLKVNHRSKISTSLSHVRNDGFQNYGNNSVDGVDGYCYVDQYVRDIGYYKECDAYMEAATTLNDLDEQARFFSLLLLFLYYNKELSHGYFIGSFSNKDLKFFVSKYGSDREGQMVLDIMREYEVVIM